MRPPRAAQGSYTCSARALINACAGVPAPAAEKQPVAVSSAEPQPDIPGQILAGALEIDQGQRCVTRSGEA
jgi:hypothetical protein